MSKSQLDKVKKSLLCQYVIFKEPVKSEIFKRIAIVNNLIKEKMGNMMLKYNQPRGTGKTTNLIHMSARIGATIVVHAQTRINQIMERAKELGYKDFRKPITFWQLVNKCGMLEVGGKFLVDELDLCLSSLNIVGYSNTDNDNHVLMEQIHKWQDEEDKRRKTNYRKIEFDKFENIKIQCISCGNGDNSTVEEHTNYINGIYEEGKLVFDENIIFDKPCEKCGCNTFHFTANVKLKTD